MCSWRGGRGGPGKHLCCCKHYFLLGPCHTKLMSVCICLLSFRSVSHPVGTSLPLSALVDSFLAAEPIGKSGTANHSCSFGNQCMRSEIEVTKVMNQNDLSIFSLTDIFTTTWSPGMGSSKTVVSCESIVKAVMPMLLYYHNHLYIQSPKSSLFN